MRRPSLVQVVTDLQARGPSSVNVPVPGDGGWAAAGKELSADFKRVADDVGRMADEAAKSEGTAEGREAGLDPEFRTRADPTLRNKAFNAAGLDIAETRLKTALEQSIDGLEQKHAANPKALGEGIDGVIGGVLAGAPDELRPKLQMLAGHKKLVAMRGAQRELVARTRADQAAALQTELTDGIRNLHQIAFKVGGDDQAAQVIGERMAAMQAVFNRKGIDGKPLLDPRMAAKQLADLKEVAAQGQLKGTFDRLETPEAKAQFLTRMKDDWQNGQGVVGKLDGPSFEALERELEGEMRRAANGRDVVRRALANQVKAVADAAEKGVPPNTDDLVRLRAGVVAIPELQGDLRAAEQTLQFSSGFRRLPPGEQERWLVQEEARLQDQGVRIGGGGEMARLELARKISGEARAQLKQDPLGWSRKVGTVDVQPLNFEGGATAVAAGLPRRIAEAEQIGRINQQEPVYLEPGERRQLTAMAAGGGKPLLEVAEVLATAPPEAARAMLSEMHEAGSATLAVVGGHVREIGARTPVAQDVADGVALSRTKDFKPVKATAAGGRQNAVAVHQGALNGHPEQEQALIDATNYAYGLRLQRQGKTDDASVWQQTFRELLGERKIGSHVYGGVAQHRGQAVIVPPDIRQDRFSDLLGSVEIADFEVAPLLRGQRTADIGAVRKARLEAVNAGRFKMNIGTADDPQYLKAPDGSDFVLDLKYLKPKLIARQPDAYLDGARR